MNGWAAVVLAAGKGVRMDSRLPKVLHRLCGLEMVAWVVRAVQEAGVSPIVLIVPPSYDDLRRLFGDQVAYAVQDRPRGTGHALGSARDTAAAQANALLVLNGDLPLVQGRTIQRLMETHDAAGATLTLLTTPHAPVEGLGRVLQADGGVQAVVEAADLPGDGQASGPANAGVYAFRGEWVWPHLERLTPAPSGEVYLTALVEVAAQEEAPIAQVEVEEPLEALGVNTRVHLAQAEAALRHRLNEGWMRAGVTLVDPSTTYLDATVEVGRDTVLHPNTALRGRTQVGEGCEIGPNALVADTVIGDRCTIGGSVLEGAVLEEEVVVGPFCHLRPGAYLERGVHLGNYAEVKASRLGRGVRMGHFSYIGDADIGPGVNIGAGTITCNFDGVRKHRTVVEEGASLGSDTMLVAPVRVGARAMTGAGAVVTKDVPPDTLVVGVPARKSPRPPPAASR